MMKSSLNLPGKSFIVTGGASGLGEATARALADCGAKVIIADLNDKGGQRVALDIGGHYLKTDVTSPDDAASIVEYASAIVPLFGIVNCAGIVTGAKVVGKKGTHSLEAFQKIININLIGTFNMLRLAAEAMAENEPDADGQRGIIINTASVAAFEGQVGQAAYSASKAGVAGMTLPIARDLAELGIRCMTIAPGVFETAMMDDMPDVVRENLAAAVPFPSRLGKPSEYADLCLSIIANPMLNGEVIRLDGALRMSGRG